MPDLIRHPNVVPTPYPVRGKLRREPVQGLGPGFRQEPWIPAFAGMTILIESGIQEMRWRCGMELENWRLRSQNGAANLFPSEAICYFFGAFLAGSSLASILFAFMTYLTVTLAPTFRVPVTLVSLS